MMAGLSSGAGVWNAGGRSDRGRFGWRPFFVVLGLGSLLWLVPWLAWMPRRPTSAAPASREKSGFSTFWQRSAWGTCLGQFCINYFLYFLVTWLPFYLVRGRNLSMNEMAKAGGLVFFLSAVSAIVSGEAFRSLDRRGSFCRRSCASPPWCWDRSESESHWRQPPSHLAHYSSAMLALDRDISGHQHLQWLGDHADSGRSAGVLDDGPGCRTLSAIWRRGGACAHGIPVDRTGSFRLAIFYHGGRRLDGSAELGFGGGPGGASAIGRRDPGSRVGLGRARRARSRNTLLFIHEAGNRNQISRGRCARRSAKTAGGRISPGDAAHA